jgi:dihydrofolate synthase/folylpolyglutamate synthase
MPQDLPGWLEHIERLHPQAIDLTLDRVVEVSTALGIAKYCPIIIVGGTNGKGSTCMMLESILSAAAYRVGTYTSPHLLRYNARVRVAGVEAGDEALSAGFAEVERVRGSVPLTYFEFATLCAWVVFARARVDALILEIGLGGRLDAVNAFDPDCSVLTSVGLDHMEYLGATREQIGWEKAHIFRPQRPAICSEPDPPQSVVEQAGLLEADLWLREQDFGCAGDGRQWRFWSRHGARAGLAYPALRGHSQLLNASAALAALDALRERLPVAAGDVRSGLANVRLPGRFQVLPGRPVVILDVAHNPQAATVLAGNLDAMGMFPHTYAVIGMLSDKDMEGVARVIGSRVDQWFVGGLPGPRGASAHELAAAVDRGDGLTPVAVYHSIDAAFEAARGRAGENDRIVCFGSFLTVTAILAHAAH